MTSLLELLIAAKNYGKFKPMKTPGFVTLNSSHGMYIILSRGPPPHPTHIGKFLTLDLAIVVSIAISLILREMKQGNARFKEGVTVVFGANLS